MMATIPAGLRRKAARALAWFVFAVAYTMVLVVLLAGRAALAGEAGSSDAGMRSDPGVRYEAREANPGLQ